ncbi:Membrane-associated guanylate kinase, WW and PDZ domain-containing protein 3 [Clarias magur]|uniref:Membrane-associated guanylate kinase, WW and PDZ domain-containing protein 3 n=1 Tax=Clarias magur TaxID=1594786 RepID=A0A8J4WYL9_CLAMG|nr:Membrane-associated guanylate kinase, WW and PDZ domain-containing protein 3 [Clarias magur]
MNHFFNYINSYFLLPLHGTLRGYPLSRDPQFPPRSLINSVPPPLLILKSAPVMIKAVRVSLRARLVSEVRLRGERKREYVIILLTEL